MPEGIKETRDGASDEYVAKARGFRSVDEWIEFRDASPEKREQIIKRRRGGTPKRARESRPAVSHAVQQAYARYADNDDTDVNWARERTNR